MVETIGYNYFTLSALNLTQRFYTRLKYNFLYNQVSVPAWSPGRIISFNQFYDNILGVEKLAGGLSFWRLQLHTQLRIKAFRICRNINDLLE